MTKTSNLQIRQRILSEAKRRNFLTELKKKSKKANK